MVELSDIPDFPGMPGQRPTPGAPTPVAPIAAVLVTAPLDREYRNVALNTAAVDAFIAAEINAGRAHSTNVERWSPWSVFQTELSFDNAVKYNYARFTVGNKNWYAFVDAEYLNLTTTQYNTTADAWTTYQPTIGYSKVTRGHVAVAASSSGNISYCLEPEPFTPGELIGYNAYTHDPLGTARVLVISTTDLNATPFVAVDNDVADTAANFIGQTNATGTITAPGAPLNPEQVYGYAMGSAAYDDLFYYPYADSPGLSSGNQMFRPRAVGAVPSLVDGIMAEGGAFVYPSIGAAITHLSKLAHTPWIADGIQRAILIPGGSTGSNAAVNLSPRNSVVDITGGPTYYSSFTTEIGYNTTLAADWTAGLPAAYSAWTKLRTSPYSQIEIADRQGGASEYNPQNIVGLGSLRLRVEGVFHPTPDVAAWIVGADGDTAPNAPTHLPVAVELPHYAVGRDSVLATQAAGLSAERSQTIVDMLLAIQKANTDRAYTMSSAYTSTQFAIAEAI